MLGLDKKIGALMLGAGLLLTGHVAQAADTYPSKPVHILVPYAAGGAVDVLARTLGQALAKSWGQQPVIDNRPGAGGIVASQALTQAAPDGYTLILVASGHPLNQFIYPSVPYDTFKDFTAISEVASSPLAIVVAKDSPYKTLGDLLAAAKKEPDKLSYGMSGNGTSAHLAGELLKYMSGTRIVAIPYKGGAPALTAVIAGEIPLSINPLAEAIGQLTQLQSLNLSANGLTALPEAIGQLEGGPVRALAVTSAERSKALPDIPTVAESGVPGYDVSVWWGMLGPAKMPPEIVAKLEADLKAALQDPNVVSTLGKIGAAPVGSSARDFDAYMHAEAVKWAPVLKAADIRAQ